MTALEEGTALLAAGRVREAAIVLARAEGHAAHHNLAVALRAQGAVAAALEHATTARALAPSCAATLALVGSLHALQGDRAAAVAAFRAADPVHAVSRYYLAIDAAQAGDRALAIELLRGLEGAPLPELIHERVRGQLADLLAGHGPIAVDLCSTPIITEIIGPAAGEGASPGAVRDAGAPIELAEAIAILARARRIVALTGAGISSASGLATRKELWRRHDRDSAVSIARFRRDPLPLWTTIRAFLAAGDAQPNAAHRALAALPRLTTIVTQNVDGLHQAAGATCPVIELHGTLLATRCDHCGARPAATCAELVARDVLPPPCACGATLRPDVVLFGEWVLRDRLAASSAACVACDVLLVIGTAADVAPAADLAMLAASHGAVVIELKRTASRLARTGARHLAGTAEELLPRLVEGLA